MRPKTHSTKTALSGAPSRISLNSEYSAGVDDEKCGHPASERLQLHQHRKIQPILTFPQIRNEAGNQRACCPAIAAGRRYSSRSGEIGHVGRAMVVFQPPSEELAGHVIEGSGGVPGLVRIAGILTEIGRSRSHCGAIDRRQQYQIAAGIVDFPSAQREAKQILVKPESVVRHEAQETLLRA